MKTSKEAVENILKQSALFRTMLLQEMQPLANTYDLTLPQLRILFDCRDSKDGLTIRQLVELYHMTPGAISQFVDKLAEKKLIVRKEDSDDRRITRLYLTLKAKAKLRDIQKMVHKRVAVLFKDLSDEEILELSRLLSKCTGQLNS
jgi:DNA-binding MarR family transcriptional regulator